MCTFWLSSINFLWGHFCCVQIWIAMLHFGVFLYMCVYYVFLTFYLDQLSFCLSSSLPFLNFYFTNYIYSISYRELILEVTFPVEVHRAFLSFACAFFFFSRNYLFVVYSVHLLWKVEKYNRAHVSPLIFVCCMACCQH